MSVQPGPTFKRYAANGVATVYAIPFLLLDAADLQIALNGAPVTTGFTLSGIGSPTSSCTFAAAPTGDLLFLQVVPFQRLADYQINGDFLAQTVNRDFDRLWLAIKQLSRDNTRGLTVSLLEPEGIPPLPAKAVRALKMLAFDASGDPITSSLTMAQLEQQPALALGAATAAAASATASGASATASGVSATASATSATLAQKWAENPEDTPVTPGLFSAHHWANKAAAIAASLSALFARMTTAENKITAIENKQQASGCLAWVNFNGVGTVSIRGSFNVASVVRIATGTYTVTFTVPLPNTNCAVVTGTDASSGRFGSHFDTLTLNSVRILTKDTSNGALSENSTNSVIIFGAS